MIDKLKEVIINWLGIRRIVKIAESIPGTQYQLRDYIWNIFDDKINDRLDTYESKYSNKTLNLDQANVRDMVRTHINDYIKSEEFIDALVVKLNNKQLG